MKVGILGIQGDFELHAKKIEAVGLPWILVKKPSQLNEIDGLILPGGESTTITKIIDRYGLKEELRDRIVGGLPVFATCAGLIMLAKEFEGEEKEVLPTGVLNVKVLRNAYGRQRESFEAPLEIDLEDKKVSLIGVFIRAPKIVKFYEGVKVLGTFDSSPVIVRQGNILAMTFHPELTEDVEIYRYFEKIVKERK